jgi:hypothetical protein
MANSTLMRSAVALLGCLLLTAAQSQEARPQDDGAVAQEQQRRCRTLPRPGSRIAHRQCATATQWVALDQQKADRARVTHAYPHEGTYGYNTPPSIVMNR